ncbi:cysteine desulfurase [Parvibaculum sp.]|uniref:cysteine desulfurase n=1 Tax=Parvibaculum sp. TaxID=2024848 RepID=UPI00391B37C0
MNGPALADVGYDVDRIRKDFPILSSTVYGKPLVYLDNAASAQKPQVVIDAITDAYAKEYSNVHRGMHYLSNIATERFEQARETARGFLNAESSDEIVFTSGATDAINLVASSFAEPRIEPGDEIILSILEHHSNIVPWYFLRERHGAVLKFVPVTDTGDLDVEAYRKLFTSRTKMVALTQMSNALGTITPIREMIKIAHERDVPVLVDGCQGVVHMPTDVRDMDCDFLVCSGHKLYGPTGIGLLYAKSEHLKAMRPYRGGGEMIREVSPDKVTYAAPPHRFEAGTPAIVQAIGLGAALSYIQSVGRDRIAAHETVLRDYATRRLSEINSLRIIGTTKNKGSIVSFVMENAHPHDIATVIDRAGVAVRAGHHCAQPVMERFGVGATTRASFGMYNTLEEVDRLADALIDSKKFFG